MFFHFFSLSHLSPVIHDSWLQLDRDLVRAGAILHDVSKTATILAREKAEAGEPVEHVSHPVLGGRVLRARGLPEALAHVVETHGEIDRAVFAVDKPLTESELVCYADKRVTGTAVVSLASRKADLSERYPEHVPWMNENFVLFEQVEVKINRLLACGDVDVLLAPLLLQDIA